MHVLITGVAGFIGFHLAKRMLSEGQCVTGIDNLNPYYSVQLKKDRLDILSDLDNFSFKNIDLTDKDALNILFEKNNFSHVVNLAAQAGVRYSLINPQAYIASNLVGFANLLESCRHYPVEHLLFASSSSVYGLNTNQPYSPHSSADHPVSLYAATKKANEAMAHAYSHLYGIPTTGLRFFTVYGPWGRPDMALQLFTEAILKGDYINVFNNGKMRRDFTYIDDIVDGLVRLLPLAPKFSPSWNAAQADPGTSSAPWRILNIGNDTPIELGEFITTLEQVIGKKAKRKMLPMQDGDVVSTWADISELKALTGFSPNTPLKKGIQNFYNWFCRYKAGLTIPQKEKAEQ